MGGVDIGLHDWLELTVVGVAAGVDGYLRIKLQALRYFRRQFLLNLKRTTNPEQKSANINNSEIWRGKSISPNTVVEE